MLGKTQREYILGSADTRWSLSRYHLWPDLGGDPSIYMYRWIFHTPWGSLRLHRIMRSDHDRDLHDHPMDFWTFLLGEYVEVLPAELFNPHAKGMVSEHVRRCGSLRFVKAETPHRLVLTKPVWTVVWAYPKRRDWGFYTGGMTGDKWTSAHKLLGRTTGTP